MPRSLAATQKIADIGPPMDHGYGEMLKRTERSAGPHNPPRTSSPHSTPWPSKIQALSPPSASAMADNFLWLPTHAAIKRQKVLADCHAARCVGRRHLVRLLESDRHGPSVGRIGCCGVEDRSRVAADRDAATAGCRVRRPRAAPEHTWTPGGGNARRLCGRGAPAASVPPVTVPAAADPGGARP